ncbi:hypothetical protein EB75_05565 [Mycobacterium sp. ST-F2]|uniref:hypothetical protein n=1 Tax=Mycobacterium sp. ST-F2 TaxID=1490484 RepID=UPI00093FCFD4|nr:hypothetical protein [Mycobacterium sp. ST-F2]OKH84254.1 hypothetical protein EB75_05565 [Mycobacterium sp. ST-F2]
MQYPRTEDISAAYTDMTYSGHRIPYLGSGDPEAAAINSAYKRGAGAFISRCDWTEFGVGFIRHEDRSVDVVTIVFGKPLENPGPDPKAADTTNGVPANKPVEKPPIQCPEGSPTPTVPAGQQCAPIPIVTNAIQASFGDPGLTTLTFNVTNTSKLEATCNYTATTNSINPAVPKKTTRQFNVPANGSHTETFNGAITFTTYNAVLSCRDATGRQTAELGHVETSVTW